MRVFLPRGILLVVLCCVIYFRTWTSGGRKIPASSNGEPATYSVALDAVVFANGAVIGPQRSREALELVGMIQGIGAIKVIQPEFKLGPISGGMVGGVLK